MKKKFSVSPWRLRFINKARKKRAAKPPLASFGPPWTWLLNRGPYKAQPCTGTELCMCVDCLGAPGPNGEPG